MSQQLPIIITFKNGHNPGTPSHLQQIAYNHFRSKGIQVNEQGEIVI